MLELFVKPDIYYFESVADFIREFHPGKRDLIITNEYIYKPYFSGVQPECTVIYQEKYGTGEPSDEMVEAMYADIGEEFDRVIGIGGGTIMDIAKLFALKNIHPVLDLFDGKTAVEKNKTLVLVPSTCGTGSEVTNISILALKSRYTKKGLVSEEMYADSAVLIPQLLEKLPLKVFATSSIDALIHSTESALSPKASATTKIFSYRAMEMILRGYQEMIRNGMKIQKDRLTDFLMASDYAGIAFGNAGCGAVHALSYPLGAVYHVAHGESNYAMFTGVMKNYLEIRQDGEIEVLNRFLASVLECPVSEIYAELEKLLNHLIMKKPLHEYGVRKEELPVFAQSVVENQQRLLKNNFVPFDYDRILKIYSELY